MIFIAESTGVYLKRNGGGILLGVKIICPDSVGFVAYLSANNLTFSIKSEAGESVFLPISLIFPLVIVA